MRVAFALAWLPALVVALRERVDGGAVEADTAQMSASGSAQSSIDVGSGIQLGAGVVLRGRYVLQERISEEYGPGKIFPQALTRQYGAASHLGTGSFGDTWKAYDSHLKKEVAVKIFYDRDRDQYLSWLSADFRQKQELKENAQECSMVQKMMKSSSKYPVGASRICQCYEEHVMDAQHTDKPVFLVLEMCGRELSTVLKEMGAGAKTNVTQARHLIRQAIEGIAFIEKLFPPLIHHDLKPGNLVVDGDNLKIIDWGGTITSSDMFGSAVYTPVYAAPEVLEAHGRFTFKNPVHSYDIYALGLIYMELLCPKVGYRQWFDHVKETHFPLMAHNITKWMKLCPDLEKGPSIKEDVQLISRMVSWSSRDRPAPSYLLDSPPLKSTVTTVAPVRAPKEAKTSTSVLPWAWEIKSTATTTVAPPTPSPQQELRDFIHQFGRGQMKSTTTVAPVGSPKFKKWEEVVYAGLQGYISEVRFENGQYVYDVHRRGGGNLPLKAGARADELARRPLAGGLFGW